MARGGGREAQCPQDAGLAGLFTSFGWRFQVAEIAKCSLETKTENQGDLPYTTRISHQVTVAAVRAAGEEGTLRLPRQPRLFGIFLSPNLCELDHFGGGTSFSSSGK